MEKPRELTPACRRKPLIDFAAVDVALLLEDDE